MLIAGKCSNTLLKLKIFNIFLICKNKPYCNNLWVLAQENKKTNFT